MNKNKKLKQRSMISLVASAAFLAGCGGSSSSGGAATSPVSGVAFDGYLIGATVCADLNRNKACDAGEPTTTTSAPKGEFTLNLTDAQKAFPLVLQANAGTIDTDTNATPALPLTYSAPAGATTVSAITTVLQSKIEAALASGAGAGKTQAQLNADANAALAAELGVTDVDLLNTDVIAGKNNTGNTDAQREALAKLHLLNQVLTQQIATVLPAAQANAAGNNTAAFNALVSGLNVAAVIAAVNTDTAGLALNELLNANQDSVVSAPQPTAPSTADIAAQAQQDAAANAAAGQIPPSGGTGSGG